MNTGYRITRRWFVQGSAALAIQVSIPQLGLSQGALPRSLAEHPDLDLWLAINADGTLSISPGKCELGQGIRTALAQIAAEELDVAFERIRVATVDTDHSPNEGRTTGSLSIQRSGTAIRVASAEARHLLLANAAAKLDVPAERLGVEDGRILLEGQPTGLSYWELLSAERFNTEASGSVQPKRPDQHRVVGTSQERLDLPAKFFGEPAYVHDLSMPGMLHARVVRPTMDSARLIAVETESVEAMGGAVSVVRDGSFLAVVAEREEQAVAAAEALGRAATWEQTRDLPEPNQFPQLLHELPGPDPEVIFEHVEADSNPRASVVRELTAQYSRPYIAHASMSPSAAVASWDGARMTVWSHAQGMYPLRGAIATVLGLAESQVRCIHAEGAGCYGQNGADDAGVDAAMIARTLEGTPIRLVWSRQDEFRREPYGSAMSLHVSAGLDASNRIARWDYDLWSCTHSTRPAGGATAGNLLAAREKTNPLTAPPPYSMRQPNGGGDRNAVALYAFPEQRVTKHFVTEHPLRVSALRGLGAFGNVFAIESFMDELALAAGVDPLEFRLQHLQDSRARDVVEAVSDLAARRGIDGSGEGTGRGVAFARYKNQGAYLAMVVEVAVNPDSGVIRFQRAVAAADAGQVINPDGVRNQIEGGIIQSASWTLKEAVRFSATGIESVDWASYPILRFAEVPELEVMLINRPELPPVGAGEVSQGPTAAAIANAVADATGVRLRHLPMTPERVASERRAQARPQRVARSYSMGSNG